MLTTPAPPAFVTRPEMVICVTADWTWVMSSSAAPGAGPLRRSRRFQTRRPLRSPASRQPCRPSSFRSRSKHAWPDPFRCRTKRRADGPPFALTLASGVPPERPRSGAGCGSQSVDGWTTAPRARGPQRHRDIGRIHARNATETRAVVRCRAVAPADEAAVRAEAAREARAHADVEESIQRTGTCDPPSQNIPSRRRDRRSGRHRCRSFPRSPP